MRGRSTQGSKAGIIVAIVLCALSGLLAAVMSIGVFFGGSYTTSWGEEIKRNDRFVSVDGETLTQEDLEHIAGLRQLSYLRLHNCNVAECRLPDLKFASNELFDVDLSGTTGLWDLSFLSTLQAEYLDLSDCPRVDDISQLNWDVLSEVNVSGTDVSDLSPVAGSQLRRLYFAHTKVSDLSPLADAEQLWGVDGSYTQVSSLEPLMGLPSLWELSFNGCPIKTIEGTFASEYLHVVRLAGTNVKSLDCLADDKEIRELDLGGCARLKDLSWLDRRCGETLEVFDVGSTRLSAEDLSWLSECQGLKQLVVDGIALGNLDFCRSLTELESISALGCELTDVSGIKNCANLKTILLGFNELERLEGLPAPSEDWPQTVLDLSHNKLASLSALPSGSYRALFLQGNGEGAARTIPADVHAYNVVVTWFSGIEDSRLRDYARFSRIYLLGAPAEDENHLEDIFMPWHLSCMSEEDVLQRLEEDDLVYTLNLDMTDYVEFARRMLLWEP